MFKINGKLLEHVTYFLQRQSGKRATFVSRGFTIVELLIVIVIIGILAAIVIVAYSGITNSAKDASLKADMANIAKKLDAHKVLNGIYPARTNAALDGVNLKINTSNYVDTRNNVYYCASIDGNHYAVGIDATNNTEYYMLDGEQTLVANGSVNGANTCARLTNAGYANDGISNHARVWDTVTSTGYWATWAQ